MLARLPTFTHGPRYAVPDTFVPSPYLDALLKQTGLPFSQPLAAADGVGVHISLSRPFTLRYEQIQAFIASLRTSIHGASGPLHITLHEPAVFVNDSGTRTFAASLVSGGKAPLTTIIQRIDSCLISYGKCPYYSPAIPHASLSVLPGDGTHAARAGGVHAYQAREEQRAADTVRTGVDAILVGSSSSAAGGSTGPCGTCGGHPSGTWPVLTTAGGGGEGGGAQQACLPSLPQPTTWLCDAIYVRAGHQVHRVPFS